MTPGNIPAQFTGGPLDGGEVKFHPLQNTAMCRSSDWPEGCYYAMIEGRMLWIVNDQWPMEGQEHWWR